MPPNAHLSAVARSAAAVPVLTLLDTGYLALYEGAQPPTVDTPLSGQTLLVELRFGSPAFGPPSGGVAAANPITPGTAVASGQIGFFRCCQTDHISAVLDGSVGTSDADMVLNQTAVIVGATVAIASFTYAQAG